MPPVIGFAGFSNSGKTTLLARVVAVLRARGYRVAVMKHDAHGHYKQAEGKDSAIFQQAGANETVVVSPDAIHRYKKVARPVFWELIDSFREADVVLVEGFKSESHPKIAVFRTQEQSAILDALGDRPIAIATQLQSFAAEVPVFGLDDVESIVDFIERRAFKRERI